MTVEELNEKFYGASKFDGTKLFYEWIRASVNTNSRVLNLGAGPPTIDPRRILKGEVAWIAGADIDPIVIENTELDEAKLIEGEMLPFSDGEFDVVFCDYVMEHVEDPRQFLREIARVMRPAGKFFFRTPNIFHYVAAISMFTPHFVHKLIAHGARANSSEAHEPYPTFYRMNSKQSLQRLAAEAAFQHSELKMVEMEPSYLKFNSVAFLCGIGYERIVNTGPIFSSLRANIFGCFQK